MKAHYDARAPEYDDIWLGRGRFAERSRSGWDEERDALIATLRALPPARTLDVACGTGFLTRHLPGEVIGLDQSPRMLEIAGGRVEVVEGDALALPFADGSFERVFTSFFYGHLEEGDRVRFLAEARRVASELIVVDAAPRDGVPRSEWQERELDDGSRWQVYKRYFSAEGLAAELGGGRVLHSGPRFLTVAA